MGAREGWQNVVVVCGDVAALLSIRCRFTHWVPDTAGHVFTEELSVEGRRRDSVIFHCFPSFQWSHGFPPPNCNLVPCLFSVSLFLPHSILFPFPPLLISPTWPCLCQAAGLTQMALAQSLRQSLSLTWCALLWYLAASLLLCRLNLVLSS